MRFRICTILRGMFAIYELEGGAVDQESIRFERAVINPTNKIPRVHGVKYFYTYDKVQQNCLVPTGIEGQAIGINSGFEEFEASNVQELLSNMIAAIGIRKPLLKRYQLQLDVSSLNNFWSFLSQSASEAHEYSDYSKATVEDLLFGSPKLEAV